MSEPVPHHRTPGALVRQPTPHARLYAWHQDALDGLRPVIREDAYCGWYKRRYVRGGPWVPARIWMEQPTDDEGLLTDDEKMLCEVGGKLCHPEDEFSWLAGNPITKEEFEHLMRVREWARVNRVEPAGEPYDFNTMKPDF